MLRTSLVASALVLLVPASASAVTTYRASVSGTYTASGQVTNPTCWSYPQGKSGPLVPQTLSGEAKETVTFRTTRPSLIYVQRRSDFPAVALSDDDRPVFATARVERSSTLDDLDLPRGCKHPPEQAPDCGRRTVRFAVGFGSSPSGVVADLTKDGRSTRALFDNCATTVGMSGFAAAARQVPAKVSAARLLRGGRLVLHVRVSDDERLTGTDATGGGRHELKMKVTLTQVR